MSGLTAIVESDDFLDQYVPFVISRMRKKNLLRLKGPLFLNKLATHPLLLLLTRPSNASIQGISFSLPSTSGLMRRTKMIKYPFLLLQGVGRPRMPSSTLRSRESHKCPTNILLKRRGRQVDQKRKGGRGKSSRNMKSRPKVPKVKERRKKRKESQTHTRPRTCFSFS